MPKTPTRVDVDALLVALAVPQAGDDVDGRVLDASSSLLSEHGLSGLEVDDVAAASGVGRSTIYRRFADRNGLISATIAAQCRRFFSALAHAVGADDDLEDQVVAAFAAGLRIVRLGTFGDLLRTEPLLLRLVTVDSGPVVAAACDQIVAEATRRRPALDADDVSARAELLVRLAISFVLLPETALDLDDAEIEDTLRRHLGPLVRGA
ncbi:MAG: TetR family transcriptional regulator [Acidimicrobiales bacterium]|nr:TetR family transcriptional regulator [Acidimicrobiales bacterium]